MNDRRPIRHVLKTQLLALAAALSALAGTAVAQDFSLGWNPRSGDVWVDSQLDDVNRYGGRYREPFVDELVRYQGAPRSLVTELLDRRWAPGDVYMACSIAAIIGRPCRYVADEWERDHGQGWGELAKRMGIKPGSTEFHRLKRGFVPTYDRWGRPIVIDTELSRDFPGRRIGQAKSGNGPDKPDNSGKPKPGKAGTGKGKSGPMLPQARGEPTRGPVPLDALGADRKPSVSPLGKWSAADKGKSGNHGQGKDKH